MLAVGGLATLVFLISPVAAAAAQGVAYGQSQQPVVTTDWTLEDAVTAALAQHPLVDAARARVDAARGDRATAAALPNPIATWWMEDAPYPGRRAPEGLTREMSLYLTYPIEPFFQRPARIRQAEQEVKAAEASLLLARRLVAAQTVRAFFGLALAQVLQEEAEETRNRLEQLVSYNRVRVEAGVTAEGELLRLQVELDRAENDVVLAEVECARHRARLAPYLGRIVAARNGGEIRAAVPTPATLAVSSIPALDQVMATARDRRPEVVEGRARAAAAASAVAYERSLGVRQLGATFGNKQSGGSNSMIASIGLTVPLFNLNRGGIDRAAAERAAAEHEVTWIELGVEAEVQSTYGSAMRLTRQLGTLQKTFLARAEQVHQLTLAVYQEGGATLLQVLDTTRMLADARLMYSRTLFAQRESLFDLALASGATPSEALDLLLAWSTPPTLAGARQ